MTAPVLPSPPRRGGRRGGRLETWLWTGPLGHLLGGALDFGQAFSRYLLARVRGRTVR